MNSKDQFFLERAFVAGVKQIVRSKLWSPAEQQRRLNELERIRDLYDLLQHFGINFRDEQRWLLLALALADKHYPNGVKRPGRPRTRKVGNAFGVRRKSGRPRKRFGEKLRKRVDAEIAQLGLRGRGSDKKALESLLRKDAKEKNASEQRALRAQLLSCQKILSRARQANSQNSKETNR